MHVYKCINACECTHTHTHTHTHISANLFISSSDFCLAFTLEAFSMFFNSWPWHVQQFISLFSDAGTSGATATREWTGTCQVTGPRHQTWDPVDWTNETNGGS